MNVAAITGFSGAGKTTLIVQLIERFTSAGQTVGAIKHTHHPLNEEYRGDTGRFLAAGAAPVILAGAGEAVVFHPSSTSRIAYRQASDLLASFDCDIVLIEGFKQESAWPMIAVEADARPSGSEVAERLARIWAR